MYLFDSIDKGTGLTETVEKEVHFELDFKIMLLYYLQSVNYRIFVFFLDYMRNVLSYEIENFT